MNNLKFKSGLIHPPLSTESLTGRGFWQFDLPFFGGKKGAFTLAEVLITLVIIGVVAALTIPTLMKKYQTHIFKTAYKQAYSDINQAFAQAFKDGGLIRTTISQEDATTQEWNILKQNLKISKECAKNDLFSCWAEGDTVCDGTCGIGVPKQNKAFSFIDAAGRSWTEFTLNENIFLVDTNGFKGPNKFGQDRFIFTFYSTKNTRTNTYDTSPPVRVSPYLKNITQQTAWCHYPPCYYYDWLYK